MATGTMFPANRWRHGRAQPTSNSTGRPRRGPRAKEAIGRPRKSQSRAQSQAQRQSRARSTRRRSRGLQKARSGIDGFDQITGGGLPKGRTTLICGGPGCGKTLFGIEFLVNGAVDLREPGVFIAFEETAEELTANVASLGFELDVLIKKKMLSIDFIMIDRNEIAEAGEYDLEGLFVRLGYAIDSIGAKRVVLDSIEALFSGFTNDALLRSE